MLILNEMYFVGPYFVLRTNNPKQTKYLFFMINYRRLKKVLLRWDTLKTSWCCHPDVFIFLLLTIVYKKNSKRIYFAAYHYRKCFYRTKSFLPRCRIQYAKIPSGDRCKKRLSRLASCTMAASGGELIGLQPHGSRFWKNALYWD